jgi:hypothetical protein
VRLAAFDIGDEADTAGILVERRIVETLRLRQPDALIFSALVSSPALAPRGRASSSPQFGHSLDRFAGCLAGLACTARLPRLRPGTNVQAI